MNLNKIKSLSVSDFGKSSLIVFSLKLAGVFIFFLLSIFITNTFDADIVGRYDFARSLLLIIGGLNLIGFEQSIIYYSGRLRAKNDLVSLRKVYIQMVKAISLLYLVFILLVWALPASWLNNLFDKEVYDLVLKVTAVIYFHSLMLLNIEFLRGNNKLLISESIRNLGRYIGFFLLAVFLLYSNHSLWLAEVFLLNYVFLGLLTTAYIYVMFFYGRKESLTKTIYSTKEIVITSYPMALSTMTFFLLQNTDVIFLSKYVSYSEVAYYSVAVKIAMLTAVVMMAISTVVAPKVSEIFALKQMNELKALMRKSAFIIFMISLPLFLVLLMAGSYILSIFGEEYTMAIYALYILIIGQLGNAFSGPTGTYLNMTGRQKVLQFILLSAFVLNIILNIILIPIYGIEGAAIATASTTILWNLVAVLYVYKKDKVKIFLH